MEKLVRLYPKQTPKVKYIKRLIEEKKIIIISQKSITQKSTQKNNISQYE